MHDHASLTELASWVSNILSLVVFFWLMKRFTAASMRPDLALAGVVSVLASILPALGIFSLFDAAKP